LVFIFKTPAKDFAGVFTIRFVKLATAATFITHTFIVEV